MEFEMIWMPKASVLLYLSKYMTAHLLFRQSVAGLEDIICTCSYAYVQKKNGEIIKSEIKAKRYFLQDLLDKCDHFYHYFFFCREKKIGGLTLRALTLISKTTSELPLCRVHSERLALFTSAE